MGDTIEDSQRNEARADLIERLLRAFPEADQETQRLLLQRAFARMDRIAELYAEKDAGRRGLWWPNSELGLFIFELDPAEWEGVARSGQEGARRWVDGFLPIEDPEALALRLAKTGEDFLPVLRLIPQDSTPKPAFWEELAKQQREGDRRRHRKSPDHERLFDAGTKFDLAAMLLTFHWAQGIRLETTELPPFALWTDHAIVAFFRATLDFPADWQAIRNRRTFFKLKQPSWILIDEIYPERINEYTEEIEIGDGIRLGHCRKQRRRKA